MDGTPIYRLLDVDPRSNPPRDAIDREVHRIALEEELKIRGWEYYPHAKIDEASACR